MSEAQHRAERHDGLDGDARHGGAVPGRERREHAGRACVNVPIRVTFAPARIRVPPGPALAIVELPSRVARLLGERRGRRDALERHVARSDGVTPQCPARFRVHVSPDT
ncbi:hypothetical protein AB0E62_20950 [Streptomyces sp. NPDC038707]|uniref:hypothetical protein n=1 Tax=Streptomyces sp. NPDC038707 TaxID=3154329 RepID=UPI0033CE5995